MSYKVKSDETGSAVSNILYQFTADIQAGVRNLTDEKAEKLKKLIQEGAPVNKRRTKRRGTYKKSWRIRKTKDTFAVYEKNSRLTAGVPLNSPARKRSQSQKRKNSKSAAAHKAGC